MTLSGRMVGACLVATLLGPANAYSQDSQAVPASPAKSAVENAKSTSPLQPLRLYMADGAALVGELTPAHIVVKTEYGSMTIPFDRIRGFTPGLDSRPQLTEQFRSLIKDLEADEFVTRETAHRQIMETGLPFRRELKRLEGEGDALWKRNVQLTQIELEKLEERLSDRDYKNGKGPFNSSPVWIRPDRIVTADSVLTGKISPEKFTIRGKFGEVTIALADVVKAQRMTETKQVVDKQIVVSGLHIAQRRFKSSRISVRPGDRITVRADGQIRMPRWESGKTFSSPDGAAKYQWYIEKSIPGGALIAKIGGGGKEFKVGRKHEFVADRSGILLFAVGIVDPYGREGAGVNFSGHYDVQIKVDPR